MLFNNTRVVEARLLFQKPTGGVIEIFCLEPHDQYTDITSAMLQQKKILWKCLVGGASKWKPGQILEKKIITGHHKITLEGKYIEKKPDHFIIELSWSPQDLSFAELLHFTGAVPLPPYIKRKPGSNDAERYQTIYAHHDGSVAAPTAGLHFTSSIFEKFKEKNIQTDFVTLHVGAGTFKPVKSEKMNEHEMHAEFIDVPKKTIENILKNISNTIIAVGTTSLRTIESLYWTGVKLVTGYEQKAIEITQWEVYDDLPRDISPVMALQSLLDWMGKNKLERLITKTRIIIAPGYKTNIVSALVTNFHQPNSTLLLLVAALIGEDWKKVYDYALANNFRFLSYGDGCLLWVRKD
jgi:S-adenosylmethionine:tRNA ribosyltransferase-isomerase